MSRKIRNRVKLNKKIANVDKRYQNEDDTFKSQKCPDGGGPNKFCGCVNYQMNVGNYSQERAEKICGAIKKRKGGATILKKYDSFEKEADRSKLFVSEMKKEADNDTDPYLIAKYIADELREEVEPDVAEYFKHDEEVDPMDIYNERISLLEEKLDRLSEWIEPYVTYYSDCHEIIRRWGGSTSNLEDLGATGYDEIAQSYAYQIIEQETYSALESVKDEWEEEQDRIVDEIDKAERGEEGPGIESSKRVVEKKVKESGLYTKRSTDPYDIAQEIYNELKSDVVDGIYDNMEDALDLLSEFIDPYVGDYNDCHLIVTDWEGDTSHFDTLGATGYDAIACAYAYQIIDSEVWNLVRKEDKEQEGNWDELEGSKKKAVNYPDIPYTEMDFLDALYKEQEGEEIISSLDDQEEKVMDKDIRARAKEKADEIYNEANTRISSERYWVLVNQIYKDLGGRYISESSRVDRGRGKPLTDAERLERHKRVHPKDEAEKVEELPDRGSGLPSRNVERGRGRPFTDKDRLERHKRLHPDDKVETVEELPDRGSGLKEESGKNMSWTIKRKKGSSVTDHYKKVGEIEEYEKRKNKKLTQEEAEELYNNL